MKNFRVIATDFDGTLCEDIWPEIRKPNFEVIDYLINQKIIGNKIILWTCRKGDRLDKAVKWCELHGLKFDAVNENVQEYIYKFGGDSRKIYADEYIEDKASTRFKLPFRNSIDWKKAKDNAEEVRMMHILLDENVIICSDIVESIDELLSRYESGDRSYELYCEMMKLK